MNKDEEKLVQLAMADLASAKGAMRGGIHFLASTPKQFRDASLGVKQPGRMYAQVITPGYEITLESEGKRYVYHGAGSRVVLAKG